LGLDVVDDLLSGRGPFPTTSHVRGRLEKKEKKKKNNNKKTLSTCTHKTP